MRFRYRIPPDPAQTLLYSKELDPFEAWARLYFKKGRLNAFIPYRDALESFRGVSPISVSSVQFKKRLTAWCMKKGYTLDPTEHRNAGGRIIRKREVALGRWVAAEMLYIKTPCKQ